MIALMDGIQAHVKYFQKIRSQIGLNGAVRARTLSLMRAVGFSGKIIKLSHELLKHDVYGRIKTTDFDTFYQVFIDEQYSITLGLSPITIVDCGANVGYTSAYFLSQFPAAHVISIEPFPANVDLCRRNLEPYGARASVHAAAIWSAPRTLEVNGVEGKEWGVKVRVPASGDGSRIEAIDIPSLGLERIDLLKIDIEGSEIELFRDGNAAGWLPTVKNIVIELHGPECEEVFFAALRDYEYDLSSAGELTLCTNLRLRAAAG